MIESDWSKGLCDCCDNCGECALAFFCSQCYACILFSRADEPCWSLCFGGFVIIYFLFNHSFQLYYTFNIIKNKINSMAALRTKIRVQRKIKVFKINSYLNVLDLIECFNLILRALFVMTFVLSYGVHAALWFKWDKNLTPHRHFFKLTY